MTTYTEDTASAPDWRAFIVTVLAIGVVAGLAAWQIGLRARGGGRVLPAAPPISVATAPVPPTANATLPAANPSAGQAPLTSQTIVILTPDQAAALVPPAVPEPPINQWLPGLPRSFMVVQVQDDAGAMAVLRAVTDENALRAAHGLPLIEVRDLHDPAPPSDPVSSTTGAQAPTLAAPQTATGGQAGFVEPSLPGFVP